MLTQRHVFREYRRPSEKLLSPFIGRAEHRSTLGEPLKSVSRTAQMAWLPISR
jgi:hypothetical protein